MTAGDITGLKAQGSSLEPETTAVLFSAGLDSAVLLAHAAAEAGREAPVQPIYVSVGLAWEREELAMAERLFASGAFSAQVLAMKALRVDMDDVYSASHWAVRGEAPAVHTPDEAVYIEGRNIVLLSKAAVFMARKGITRVLIGTLGGNPFPDATPAFFDLMGRALSMGLAAPIRIEAPFSQLRKSDVIARGRALGVPLELTISCMQPKGSVPCGCCSKCRERRDAFEESPGGIG